jgi:two-component sensor histidine kinase
MAANSNTDETDDHEQFGSRYLGSAATDVNLMQREMFHSFTSDLQLIVSLLDIQSRRADSDSAYCALRDAMERVSVLAEARRMASNDQHPTLRSALSRVCEALDMHAEPRSVTISLDAPFDLPPLEPHEVVVVALAVNELATNALMHAFDETTGGEVRIAASYQNGFIEIVVDDDGLPLPPRAIIPGPAVGIRLDSTKGLGLGLADQLMASVGGRLILPERPSKAFELRVPVRASP